MFDLCNSNHFIFSTLFAVLSTNKLKLLSDININIFPFDKTILIAFSSIPFWQRLVSIHCTGRFRLVLCLTDIFSLRPRGTQGGGRFDWSKQPRSPRLCTLHSGVKYAAAAHTGKSELAREWAKRRATWYLFWHGICKVKKM